MGSVQSIGFTTSAGHEPVVKTSSIFTTTSENVVPKMFFL
jgi:hypothetical protein